MYKFNLLAARICYILLYSCLFLSHLSAQEICDNGIDDDSDGLIDIFDPDCPANPNSFFGQPVQGCEINRTFEFSIQEEMQTPNNAKINTYITPVVADLDGDGQVEIIAANGFNLISESTFPFRRLYRDIHIFNGQDGSLIRTISTPLIDWRLQSTLAVADVDADGTGEIIIASSDDSRNPIDQQRYLFCYNLDGTLKWQSNTQYGYDSELGGANISLADFNFDGIPEIYVYNQIFNAVTGLRLATGGSTNNIGFSEGHGNGVGLTFAADILPNEPGLELVAGNQIYSINLVNLSSSTGNSVSVVREFNLPGNSQVGDGPTLSVDMDLDGDLDIAVIRYLSIGQFIVYVWDGQSNTLMGNAPWAFNQRAGMNVDHSMLSSADIDGDCFPELVFGVDDLLIALEINNSGDLVQKWEQGNDNEFNQNPASFFDFDQDEIQEVVYRDHNNIYILNGNNNAPITLASIRCLSGTRRETPVIVDIDNDNQAELLIACADANRGAVGVLKVFGSANDSQWPPTRKVWNQYIYQPTAINDDLTIPRQQQNHSVSYATDSCGCNGRNWPFNNFMAQTQIMDKQGCPIPALQDTTSLELGANLLLCQGETVTLDVTRTGATYTWQDGSTNSSFTINSEGLYWVDLLSVNGCTLRDSIQINYRPSLELNLGGDRSICQGETLTLDATQNGANYLWQDGSTNSTFTVSEAGTYSVRVSNECDTLRAEVRIDILFANQVNLGNDTTLCPNEQLLLDATQTGVTYLWQDGSREATYLVDREGLYWVEVVNSNDCAVRDTIEIDFTPTLQLDLGGNRSLCEGETLVLNALQGGATYLWQDGSNNPTFTVNEAGTYSVRVSNECDTLNDEVQVDYKPLPNLNFGNDTLLCSNQQLLLDATQADATYLWQDGSQEASYLVDHEGLYSVEVTLNGCTITENIFIGFEVCKDQVKIPNTITANGDGVNDNFIIEGLNLNNWILTIYDRQGLEIYQNDAYQNNWDGGIHPPAVYFYLLKQKEGNCVFRGWLNVIKSR